MLADHVEEEGLQGKMRFKLFVGASSGAEIEDRWADLDMIEFRTPHQVGRSIQRAINEGRMLFQDKHLSEFPQDLLYGYYTMGRAATHADTDTALSGGASSGTDSMGKEHQHQHQHGSSSNSSSMTRRRAANRHIDVAVVEVTEITERGDLVLGASVGATPELVALADRVVVEVNTALPSFHGLHDLVPLAPGVDHPFRKAILIDRVDDRIGVPALRVDPERIAAIVHTHEPDVTSPTAPAGPTEHAIAEHMLEFFRHEISQGRMPRRRLFPLQSGIGDIANAIIGGLGGHTTTGGGHTEFGDLEVYTEVLQDTFLDFFDEGKLRFASATSVRFSPEGFQRFYDRRQWDRYRGRILLRPQSISNHPEVIRRMGVIAMNTPVEVDIYGHANSTLVGGSRMLNGLGGSSDFLRNARLSIMHFPSARPTRADPTGISCVVPFASHVDHTEHDIDVFVTEQGLADVRGMAPRQRAREIIDKCAHPHYRPILQEYVELATRLCTMKKAMHEPHILQHAFKMYTNLDKEGTMKISSWEE